MGTLPRLSSLKTLALSFHHTGINVLETLATLSTTLGCLHGLTELDLNFYQCHELTSLKPLAESLASLDEMKVLVLNMREAKLSSVDHLSLRGLKTLSLTFTVCC